MASEQDFIDTVDDFFSGDYTVTAGTTIPEKVDMWEKVDKDNFDFYIYRTPFHWKL
jgi:hypothetical protein